jgi:NitT/TauT family transport system ATP-binding protein
MNLKIEHLYKSFGDLQVFKDFSIEFEEGQITCILGPSGCGKTTLLNIICGIIPPDSGKVSGFQGVRFSYIFQEPRLLPWKTVRGNIEFVLDTAYTQASSDETADFRQVLSASEKQQNSKMETFPHKLSATDKRQIADELMKKVELSPFADYYPYQLSGGMKQRVSIARSFAIPSDIILMDEPTSGLDSELKHNMIAWFRHIWESDRRTVIYVTHDEQEANLLGDHIYRLPHRDSMMANSPLIIENEKRK